MLLTAILPSPPQVWRSSGKIHSEKRKRERGGGRGGEECHARKASTTSDFYPRGHAVASVKIKTFTGKSFGSTRREESSFMSARPCSRFVENKRRQTPFRVVAAFISFSLPLASPICITPPAFVHSFVRSFVRPFIRSSIRPSIRRKGRNLYHVFPSGLRYEKEYRALSPTAIFNRLSIVVEWRPIRGLELSARAR